ncbi:MAG TPA: hypothetical protein VGM81_13675 [Burkholderiaceae bacterium]|jgi:ElaB/YqjD/DUF883 family membrane-anchored ribosome-binding protein
MSKNPATAIADARTDQALGVREEMRSEAAAALSHAANCVEAMTRRPIEQARQAKEQVRQQLGRAGDYTAGYIQEGPIKSIAIAAAAGATAAMLLSWWASSRSSRP